MHIGADDVERFGQLMAGRSAAVLRGLQSGEQNDTTPKYIYGQRTTQNGQK